MKLLSLPPLLLLLQFLHSRSSCLAQSVLDLANFSLRPNAYGKALRERADTLGDVLGAKATVTAIMNDLNRPTGDGDLKVGQACNSNGLASNAPFPTIGRSKNCENKKCHSQIQNPTCFFRFKISFFLNFINQCLKLVKLIFYL